jgi:hypothetical protein
VIFHILLSYCLISRLLVKSYSHWTLTISLLSKKLILQTTVWFSTYVDIETECILYLIYISTFSEWSSSSEVVTPFGKCPSHWIDLSNTPNICTFIHSENFQPFELWGIWTGFVLGGANKLICYAPCQQLIWAIQRIHQPPILYFQISHANRRSWKENFQQQTW